MLLGFVPYAKWNFSLCFHTMTCENIRVLSVFQTGVMLGLAEVLQTQTNVTHQGGTACPV